MVHCTRNGLFFMGLGHVNVIKIGIIGACGGIDKMDFVNKQEENKVANKAYGY